MGQVGMEFPEEVAELILQHLPITMLCKCREVCKSWNRIITSMRFSSGWLVSCSRNRLYARHNLRAGNYWDWDKDFFKLLKNYRILSTSSTGILCLEHQDRICICNPLTSSRMELPYYPDHDYDNSACFMEIQIQLHSFIVVAVVEYWSLTMEKSHRMMVYDSTKQDWTCCMKQEEIGLEMNEEYVRGGVLLNSTLYFLSHSKDSKSTSLRSVDVLGKQNQLLASWTALPIPASMQLLEPPSLGFCAGQFVMVVLMTTEDSETCKRHTMLGVFVLDEHKEWHLFDTLRLHDIEALPVSDMHLSCNRDEFCCWISRYGCQSWLYNMSSKSWQHHATRVSHYFPSFLRLF